MFWGPSLPAGRPPRVLGLFAHPDDEVFCVGGTIARCAVAGASTTIVALTRGEAGQIRDPTVATRRTLGAIRVEELVQAGAALGVDRTTCLDLGDGRLASQPLEEVAATVRAVVEDREPDVVVTFGPDGASGHPDHIVSCLATLEALSGMARPPRLLHACFPMSDQLLLDLIVDWLTSTPERFSGTTAFAHALKLFADGTSMLGFAADHFRVEWFPAGSAIIEQGEPATELYCLLSGSAHIVVEGEDGQMRRKDIARAGSFVGQDGLATGRARNAHVIARDDVTCLVLAPGAPDRSAGRGSGATTAAHLDPTPTVAPVPRSEGVFTIDIRPMLERKVSALAAHRSQYALDPDLFPTPMLERLLGTEHFTVVRIPPR